MGLRVTIDLLSQRDPQIVPSGSEVGSSGLAKYGSVEVSRKGIGRTYRVEFTHADSVSVFYWKGSKTALSLLETGDNEDISNRGNGNLKFFAADTPDDILAVWHNRTDRQILGSLNIISRLDADSDGVLEGLMVSCLAVVVAERVSGRGWVGGLGKP